MRTRLSRPRAAMRLGAQPAGANDSIGEEPQHGTMAVRSTVASTRDSTNSHELGVIGCVSAQTNMETELLFMNQRRRIRDAESSPCTLVDGGTRTRTRNWTNVGAYGGPTARVVGVHFSDFAFELYLCNLALGLTGQTGGKPGQPQRAATSCLMRTEIQRVRGGQSRRGRHLYTDNYGQLRRRRTAIGGSAPLSPCHLRGRSVGAAHWHFLPLQNGLRRATRTELISPATPV